MTPGGWGEVEIGGIFLYKVAEAEVLRFLRCIIFRQKEENIMLTNDKDIKPYSDSANGSLTISALSHLPPKFIGSRE